MEIFECKVCKYRNVKCNFDKHLTEKHKRNIRNVPVILVPIGLKCKYCDKIFSHKQSLNRHENHRCKHNKTSQDLIQLQAEVTELQKLVHLLHLQLRQKMS